MTIGYKQVGNDTVYVAVGNVMIPVAEWSAFVKIGGSTQSVVELTAEQFAKFKLGAGVLFKNN